MSTQSSSSSPELLTPLSSDNDGHHDPPTLPPVQIRSTHKETPDLTDGSWTRTSAHQGVVIDIAWAAAENFYAGSSQKFVYIKMNWCLANSSEEKHALLPGLLRQNTGMSYADSQSEDDEWEFGYLTENQRLKKTLEALKSELADQRKEIEGFKNQTSSGNDDIHRRLIAKLLLENGELRAKILSQTSGIPEPDSELEQQMEIAQQSESESEKVEIYSKIAIKVCDPETLKGQQTGAILKIKKQTYASQKQNFAVGDHVKIMKNGCLGYIFAKNLRLSTERMKKQLSEIEWEAFFPVRKGGKCYCVRSGQGAGDCRCVYEMT